MLSPDCIYQLAETKILPLLAKAVGHHEPPLRKILLNVLFMERTKDLLETRRTKPSS